MKLNTLVNQIYHFACKCADCTVPSDSQSKLAQSTFSLAVASMIHSSVELRPRWRTNKLKQDVWNVYTARFCDWQSELERQLCGWLKGYRSGRYDYAEKANMRLRSLCDILDNELSHWSTCDLGWIGSRVAVAHASIESAVQQPNFEIASFALLWGTIVLLDTYGALLSEFDNYCSDCSAQVALLEVRTTVNETLVRMAEDVYVESY